MEQQIAILVADDDIYVRQALEVLLTRHPQTKPFAIAASVDEAIEILKKNKKAPDIILTDINFLDSKLNGIQGIKLYRDVVGENSKIMVCSMNNDQETVMKAINAGADGFVWKNESGEGIISACIKLAEGRFVVTPSIAEKLLGQAVSLENYVEILKEGKEYRELTKELKKTMYLYCYCGMSAKEIGEELNLSHYTVKSRIKTAYQLLDVTSRAEAFGKLVERQT